MYILQFCNADTKEVLRRLRYQTPEQIEWEVKNFSNPFTFDIYIADSQFRLYSAKYVNHKVYEKGASIVYSVYFKVQLSDKQPLLK